MIFGDPRARKVLGFFKAKGLLIVPQVKARGGAKLRYQDIAWVAEHAEPRVWQVLPAAMLHFPASFLCKQQFPSEIHTILTLLKQNAAQGPDLHFVSYQEIKQWADFPLPDQRTKPQHQKKQNITFRLTPDHQEQLEKLAAQQGISMTRLLEQWIEAA